MQLVENLVVAGRFRLNRLIGRGGMGSVWHATHLGLDIPCAVKFIEGEFAALAEAQARFEREAKAAAQLRSPHVVQILDHGVWENTPYIAMELLEGEDLGKRLTKLRTLPPAEINAIIQQVARALTKAHQAGIVHRDLKPDNIFLVRDDDREIVKVLDFGIAKKNTTGLDTGNNTKTGAMLGTPYYMSPEQAQGTKGVDWRSDLWSLAVIVFQMLTGRLPFESEALGDLLVKIIVAPIPVPSQIANVPSQFDRWWLRAADRDTSKRFQSAKEFADALAMTLGQSSVTDVMDRNQIGGTALMPNAPNLNPNLPTSPSAMANTPNPHQTALLATPNPAQQGGPPGGPMQQTPYPGQAPMAHGMTPGNAGNAGNTTGAPLAKTFDGGSAGIPKKSGAGVALAIGGAVLVLAVGIGGVVMMKGGKKPPVTAGTTTATAATTTPPPPVDVPPPIDTVPPVVATAPGTGATPSASATAAPPPVVAAGGGGTPKPPPAHGGGGGGAGAGGGANASSGGAPKPPPAKPTSTAKQPADLGF